MQKSRTRRHRLTTVAMAAAIGLCGNALAADASGGGHRPQVLGTPNLTGTSSLVTNQVATTSCASSRSVTATTVSASATVTAGALTFLPTDAGHGISGPGIAAGTTIVTVVSDTEVTLSAPATADGTNVSLSIDDCTVTVGLFAEAGTVSAGTSGPLNVWGFTFTDGGPGELGGSPNNTIIISQNQALTINLTNHIADAGALSIEVPASPAAPQTCPCTFQFSQPGTYVYEASANPQQPRQLAMGLSALIVVRPADFALANTAYGSATSTAFDAEALVVMNEIDPAFNNAAVVSAADVEDYNPQYFFINGKAHPNTDEIFANAGDDVLLRVANLGIRDRAFGLLNSRMDVFGDDSHQILFAHTPDVESKLLTPGQVADVHTLVDPSATVGTQFPMFDLSRHLNNGADSGVGGMVTFIDVVASGYTDPGAPVAKSVQLADTTVADDGVGNFAMTVSYAIERTSSSAAWFLDEVGGLCSGDLAPASGAGAHPNVTVTIPLVTNTACAALWTNNGDHVLWIQPSNSALVTPAGTASGDVFTLAVAGPTISGLSTDPRFANLSLNKVDGSTDVILTGSVTPSLLDYEIDSAQVCVGASPCFALDVAAPVAPSHTYALRTLTGIPVAALGGVDGPVTLNVQATESQAGPGGTPRSSTSSVVVVFDSSAPTLSGISATPNPAGPGNTPGNLNFLESTRIDLTANDAFSPVADTELFLGSVTPAQYGTGSQLRPRDGQWLDGIHDVAALDGSYSRGAYVEIPVAELLAQPRDGSGNVHIFIHAKDAAGNWGSPVDFALPIDDTKPTITAASWNAATREITVTANDSAGLVTSGLAKLQYHLNLGPESAAGAEVCMIAQCVFDIAINWADGSTHTVTYPDPGLPVTQVFVRVQDAAGNWSDYTTLP